jgi:hypothetical protein
MDTIRRLYREWRRHFLTFSGATIVLVTFIVNDYAKDPAKEQRELISQIADSFQATKDAALQGEEESWLEGDTLEAQHLPYDLLTLRVLPLERAGITKARVLLVQANHQLEKVPNTESERASVLSLLNGPPGAKDVCVEASVGCLEHTYKLIIFAVSGNFKELPADPKQLADAQLLINKFQDVSRNFYDHMWVTFRQVFDRAEYQKKDAQKQATYWKLMSGILYGLGWLLALWDTILSRQREPETAAHVLASSRH